MHGKIYIADALELDHPLNRGLVSRWMALPDQQRGVKFRDLRKRNDGTLVGGPVGGPTWVGGGRRGGYGAISTDGTYDTIVVTEPGINSGSTDYAFSIWLYPNRPSVSFHTVFDMTSRHFCAFIDDVGQFTYGDHMTSGLTAATSGLSYGSWHNWILTRTGSNLSSYVDGVLKETVSNTSYINPAVQRQIHFGSNPSGGGSLWLGKYDDIAFWVDRALSATEVSELYQEQLRGSPETLRWYKRKTYSFADVAGGNRRRRVICGAT